MGRQSFGDAVQDVFNEQGAFDDPVLRCDSCQKIIKRESLHKLGGCPKCGNRRVRNLTVFNDEEKAEMESWGFHDFVSQYEAVSDAE